MKLLELESSSPLFICAHSQFVYVMRSAALNPPEGVSIPRIVTLRYQGLLNRKRNTPQAYFLLPLKVSFMEGLNSPHPHCVRNSIDLLKKSVNIQCLIIPQRPITTLGAT